MEDDKPKEKSAEDPASPAPTNSTLGSPGLNDSEIQDAPASTPLIEKDPLDTGAGEKTTEMTDTAENETPNEEKGDIPIKKIPSVGAMAKGWSGGVSLPIGCRNIPSEAMSILESVETFLAECPMPPYNPREHQGFWRTLTVRSSRRTRECMLIFVHAPLTGGAGSKDDENTDNYSPEVFEKEKARLLSMVTGRKFPTTYPRLEEDSDTATANPEQDEKDTIEVTSVFFQEYEGLSMPLPDHPVQVNIP